MAKSAKTRFSLSKRLQKWDSRASFRKINKRREVVFKKTSVFVKRRPFVSLLGILGLFLLLMILGNVFFAPKPVPEPDRDTPKKVEVFRIGKAAELVYQGKVEKSGVIKIVAQTPGIVQHINVNEGDHIEKGTNILSLSTNYQGGNALSIARQIAGTQYSTAKNTYGTQKEIIDKQRELANKNRDNASELRRISSQSSTETRALSDLNQTIVTSIQANIEELEATNVGGVNDTAILQARQQLSQFQAALVQTNSSYQNLAVQSNSASSDIANLQHEIALKQLDLQEKTLKMNLDVARLQFNMAAVNEANMFPATPFSGVVDKIFVHKGESVNPGTVLAQISGDTQHVEIVANVPYDVASRISAFEPSTLYVGGQTITQHPTFVSRDATNGVLYSVIYNLDDLFAQDLTNQAYVTVRIPIGVADAISIDPYVPLDAVVQTESRSIVFTLDRGVARARAVKLGQIQGRYVQILEGLPQSAEVIIDRNVIDGDKVEVQNAL